MCELVLPRKDYAIISLHMKSLSTFLSDLLGHLPCLYWVGIRLRTRNYRYFKAVIPLSDLYLMWIRCDAKKKKKKYWICVFK